MHGSHKIPLCQDMLSGSLAFGCAMPLLAKEQYVVETINNKFCASNLGQDIPVPSSPTTPHGVWKGGVKGFYDEGYTKGCLKYGMSARIFNVPSHRE